MFWEVELSSSSICLKFFNHAYDSAGQGRLDGAFCEFSESDKLDYLNKLHDFGVINIEMESTIFGALTHHAGIRAAIVCVTLLDRLKGDQVRRFVGPQSRKFILSQTFPIDFRRSIHPKRSWTNGRSDHKYWFHVWYVNIWHWPDWSHWPRKAPSNHRVDSNWFSKSRRRTNKSTHSGHHCHTHTHMCMHEHY